MIFSRKPGAADLTVFSRAQRFVGLFQQETFNGPNTMRIMKILSLFNGTYDVFEAMMFGIADGRPSNANPTRPPPPG